MGPRLSLCDLKALKAAKGLSYKGTWTHEWQPGGSQGRRTGQAGRPEGGWAFIFASREPSSGSARGMSRDFPYFRGGDTILGVTLRGDIRGSLSRGTHRVTRDRDPGGHSRQGLTRPKKKKKKRERGIYLQGERLLLFAAVISPVASLLVFRMSDALLKLDGSPK